MNFREIFRNDALMYKVGYDDSGRGVMIVTVSTVGWYDLYFRLSDDEMAMVDEDRGALDDLAERFAVDKGVKVYADRLLKP